MSKTRPRPKSAKATAGASSRASEAVRPPSWVSRVWPPLLVLGLACVLCWPVFAGRIMVPGDNLLTIPPWTAHKRTFLHGVTQNEMLDPMQQYLPWRHLAVDSVRAGVIPLWNPYSYCGAPFLANLQSAVLYPPNALFLVTGAARGFGISAILHLFLGGFAMFGFLRALRLGTPASATGALIFMLNGFTVSWLEYPTVSLWTAMWLPLILWLQELAITQRRWGCTVACGVAVALTLLGGHLQVSAYVLLTLVLYTLVRAATQRALLRPLLSLAFALALGVGLALGQLLPSVELARNSLRAAGDARTALATALPWTHLVIYLMPRFFGSPATHNYWGNHGRAQINFFETSGYVGILALFLAAYAFVAVRAAQPGAPSVSRWRAFLVGVAPSFPASFFALTLALALLVALGTPLYYLLYYLVPGMDEFRGLTRIMFLAAFAVGGLAAVGVEALMSERQRLPTWPALGLAGVQVAFAGVVTIASAGQIGAHTGIGGYVGGQWVRFSILMVSCGVLLVLRVRGILPARWFARLAIVVVAADLLAAGWRFNPAVSAQLDFPATKTTDYLKAHIGSDRMTSIGPKRWKFMPPNTPLAYGLRDIHGYDSLVPASYEAMLIKACGNEQYRWPPPDAVFPWLAAVRYLVTVSEVSHPDWELVQVESGTAIYRNRRSLPRAYLVAEDGAVTPPGGATGLSFREDGTNRVRLSAESRRQARLVLSDTSYPGWRARIDGQAARPAPAPWDLFRAVAVPPGRHEVEWRYDPASFRAGLFVSLLSAAVVAAAAGAGLCQARRNRGVTPAEYAPGHRPG